MDINQLVGIHAKPNFFCMSKANLPFGVGMGGFEVVVAVTALLQMLAVFCLIFAFLAVQIKIFAKIFKKLWQKSNL